jgi:cytochrome c oxidase subunit 2
VRAESTRKARHSVGADAQSNPNAAAGDKRNPILGERRQVAAFVWMNSPMTILTGSGRIAVLQAKLGWWLLIVSLVVVAVVTLLVLAGSFRRRANDSRDSLSVEGDGEGTRPGLRWIIVGGMIAPALILLLTFAFTIATENATAAPPKTAGMSLEIIGHRWWWEVRYVGGPPSQRFVTANEIHVPIGVPVRLELTSVDVIHSFWIPQLAGKTDVIPGQRNVAWIQADKPGVYRGACTEYCGQQHANMATFVVAESPERFRQWAQAQRDSASAPADADAARGLTLFQTASCATCHAVRGSAAGGHIGPDLTHLMSRMTLAAGALENTRGNLAGWIANPQTIKPGNIMPTVPLHGTDLQGLVAYLETLK